MTDTTFEEAKRCPQCDMPGEDRKQTPAREMPPGTFIHHIYCTNPRCDWFDTPWMVQVNPDGSVPPKQNHRGKPKMYVGFEDHDRQARDIRAALEADRLNQLKSHYEIRRRP